jgi:hypothetical protein
MTTLKPWREVAIPHVDVLKGTFLQSEFAADISAVREPAVPGDGGKGAEYKDAAAFFQRTFITEGMRLLLMQVAQRLNGKGGEPVIQLQTAFGGGKTHTMLAVYHLAKRTCPLKELAGIPALLDQAGLMDVPSANVAVLDGTARAPNQASVHGETSIRTLWGELAFQLGREEGYALVQDSDLAGTSPGKEVLRALLEKYAPCVVLIDELVNYVRQFTDAVPLSGGTYDSNLSFVQALTEAAKLVPTAIVLASLPESEREAGSSRGQAALAALEKTFGRVQALWKPVAVEEAFEIVRRRLFEPIGDIESRNAVCRAFADAYVTAGAKVPTETHEAHYHERLVQAYPIHPEVFDRLYEDWTTLENFQRTRGVLKLMAHVIFRLWDAQNQDLVILPGSLPLADGRTRNELTSYLAPGWDPVIERDIDGDRAETGELERKEPRFGAVNAAHRVARTIFLGSAPSSGGAQKGLRGVDRGRVLLGCLQPGQSVSTFSDALDRLCDRLHYLNLSGEKAQAPTRFWFDTRANLRREMEDRKARFDDRAEVRAKIGEALRKLDAKGNLFEGSHIFTPSGDIPDDSALRLVFLPIDKAYTKQDAKIAEDEVLEIVRMNGSKPRFRANRLVFIAPDMGGLLRLRDGVRTALAWFSIVDDVKNARLNIDRLQEDQAKAELARAESAVPKLARECFKWLLCPVMATATDRQTSVEVYALPTGEGTYASEVERACHDNELIISAWSPIHLRGKLRELYWKDATVAVSAATVWADMQRYLYMPRMKRRSVLEQVIVKGAGSRDFFGTAYGKRGDLFEGFKLGDANVQFDDTLLLIEPDAAAAYEAAQKRPAPTEAEPSGVSEPEVPAGAGVGGGAGVTPKRGSRPPVSNVAAGPTPAAVAKAKAYFGSVDVNATVAKMRLVSVAEEIIALLAADPNANVTVTVEISAEFPGGASDQTKRAVSENAGALGFKRSSWE